MHYLLRVALASSLLLTITSQSQVNANDLRTKSIGKRLENALNKKDIVPLKSLLPEEDASNLVNRYEIFLKSFPNAKWSVKEVKPLKDGRNALEIQITGIKRIKDEKYSLKAKQVLGIKAKGGKIISQEIISEQTVIQNGKEPLSISLNIPEAVLTGTSYDFDIILNKPLGNAILAGGLIAITNNEIRSQASPSIEIKPLGGGGLFKSVKAPLKEGVQKWAAILAHPKGLISITKMVRVVSNKSKIEL